jgi:hypothetical protein
LTFEKQKERRGEESIMADATIAKLLDFSGPFDTPLLEQTVAAFYTGGPDQVREENE